nr:MAG TPA: hypothetical protein [Caudoviricetes sp.]
MGLLEAGFDCVGSGAERAFVRIRGRLGRYNINS